MKVVGVIAFIMFLVLLVVGLSNLAHRSQQEIYDRHHGHFTITTPAGVIECVELWDWSNYVEYVKADGTRGEVHGNFTFEKHLQAEK